MSSKVHVGDGGIGVAVRSRLDQSPQYWLNLQASYDLKTAEIQAIKSRQPDRQSAY
jgi:plasmid maintenance system antidote protein VapI